MSEAPALGREIGRYRLFDEIASGGMATVHLGRLLGPAGFSRTVAIKRLHPQFAKDDEFRAMFLDEARLAARIRHPNVVSTLDVVTIEDELFLVMDYVQGESLARLLRRVSAAKDKVPPRVASKILIDALLGLHAAHEATADRGQPLGIVHRDVSPQNILVGADGIARVVDFGVAKAVSRLQTTQDGQLKGKLSYMAPEQLQDGKVDRRTDVFAAGIVLWETLTGQRLFAGQEAAASVAKVLSATPEPPSRFVHGLPAALDAVALRALGKTSEARFATAREMAASLERALPPAGALEVSEWLERIAGEMLLERAQRVRDIESASSPDALSPRVPGHAEAEGSARSGLTNLSAARGVSVPPVPRRVLPLVLGAGAGAALFVGLLVAYFVIRAPVRSDHAQAEALPGSRTGSASDQSPPPSATEQVASASGISSLPEAPPPSTTRVPQSSEAPNAQASAPPAKPRQPKASAPRVDCDPPYFVDAKGAKHFKPQCF